MSRTETRLILVLLVFVDIGLKKRIDDFTFAMSLLSSRLATWLWVVHSILAVIRRTLILVTDEMEFIALYREVRKYNCRKHTVRFAYVTRLWVEGQ